MTRGPRILLIKPSSLGDVIHALPVAEAIRRRYPDAFLAWLVKREWSDILDGNPHLDEVLDFPFEWTSAAAIVSTLRALRFDWAVDLQGLFRSGVLAWLSGAQRRIGFEAAREGSTLFYTERVAVIDPRMHAVERYLMIARALDAASEKPVFWIGARPEDERWADEHVGRFADHEAPRVVLNPSARRADKRWPVERFAEVGRRLAGRFAARLVVIGGPNDVGRAERLAARLPPQAANFAGKTSLGRLAAVLRRADVVVTNDSGPMHLAAALKIPVVAVFGPTDPRKVGPYGSVHRVLEGRGDVMNVTVDEVDAAASWVLANGRTGRRHVR